MLDIEWQAVGKWAITAVPAVVALLGFLRGPGALRSKLRHDIEMLEKLPKDSDPYKKLLVYIDAQVARFARIETESSRDVQGFVVGLVLSALIWGAALWLWTLGAWYWRAGAVVVACVALAGMSVTFDSAQKVPRGEDGKPIKA